MHSFHIIAKNYHYANSLSLVFLTQIFLVISEVEIPTLHPSEATLITEKRNERNRQDDIANKRQKLSSVCILIFVYSKLVILQ